MRVLGSGVTATVTVVPAVVVYVAVPDAAKSRNPPCAAIEIRPSSLARALLISARMVRATPPDCQAVAGIPSVASPPSSVVSQTGCVAGVKTSDSVRLVVAIGPYCEVRSSCAVTWFADTTRANAGPCVGVTRHETVSVFSRSVTVVEER